MVGASVVGGACVVGGASVVGGACVDGGGEVGRRVVGGGVVGAVVVGGAVGLVDFVGVGVGVGDFEATGDFDEIGDPVAPTTTRPLPGLTPTVLPPGWVTPLPATALWLASPDWLWVGIVVLPPRFSDEELLLEISTAMIATTPMPAAPIPAIRKFRLP